MNGRSDHTYIVSITHVWMEELDYTGSCAWNNWWFWTVVWEKSVVSPLDWKAIKAVNPDGNQPWIFIGSTFAEAETLILSPPMQRTNYRKRPWCWESLSAEGEGPSRRWDDRMVQLICCTSIWANSGSYWWTVRRGVLPNKEHNIPYYVAESYYAWATEQQQNKTFQWEVKTQLSGRCSETNREKISIHFSYSHFYCYWNKLFPYLNMAFLKYVNSKLFFHPREVCWWSQDAQRHVSSHRLP